jgi:hypothetical protein
VLIVLALWTASIYWFTAELSRVHGVNQGLWQQLLAAQQAQVDLAWRCYYEGPRRQEPQAPRDVDPTERR